MREISKKGQLNTLTPMIIALVLASILLVFGLVMLQELRDTAIISQAHSGSVSNETVTGLELATVSVADATTTGFNSMNLLIMTNATGGEVIDAGNYTYTTAGAITLATYNESDVNVSYTYLYGDEAYDSATLTITGIGTFAEFWEIIVLAIVIAVVMGLLLMTFGRKGGR